MDSTNFVYWLQGFFEMTDAKVLSPNQVLMIKEHLKLVFKKETPDINPQWPNGVNPPPLVWPNPDLKQMEEWMKTNKNPDAYKVEITCDVPNHPFKPICSTGIVTNITCGVGTSAQGTSGPAFTTGVVGHNSGSAFSTVPLNLEEKPIKKPHSCNGCLRHDRSPRFC